MSQASKICAPPALSPRSTLLHPQLPFRAQLGLALRACRTIWQRAILTADASEKRPERVQRTAIGTTQHANGIRIQAGAAQYSPRRANAVRPCSWRPSAKARQCAAHHGFPAATGVLQRLRPLAPGKNRSSQQHPACSALSGGAGGRGVESGGGSGAAATPDASSQPASLARMPALGGAVRLIASSHCVA
jgi:hypothetical protein